MFIVALLHKTIHTKYCKAVILNKTYKATLDSSKTYFNNALATDESTQTIQTLAPLGDYPIKGTITGNYDQRNCDLLK